MKKKSLLSESIVVVILWLSLSTARAAIFTVTTTAPTGAGSIDAAVTSANGNGMGKDTIYFAIPGATPHTINLSAALQAINGNLLIDGTSQAGYNPLTPVPVIEFINTAVTTFTVIGGISEMRALAFNATNGHGLVLNSSGNIITGCYFGLALDGITDKGNSFHGIQINSSSNIIGGTSIQERNIIAGNDQMGIQVSGSGNSIIGNYIGTNAAGTSAVPNSQIGVQINSGPNNIIGGSSSGSSNLISGNGQTGIQVNSNSNSIIGNYIGTNAAGTSAVANGQIGIHINSASNNIIGGATPGSSNLISGNLQHGIQILAGSANFIVGNYIGTNAFGTAAIGNGLDGLVIANNSTNNKIGGASPDSSNIISGNVQHGIELNGTASNKVFGNVIGLQADKSSALGNIQHGILIFNNSNFNQIGSTGAATGNIISSNGTPTSSGIGVNIISSQGTIVKSNIIGTSANTQLARGNSSHCIQLQSGSIQTVIGGNHATEGNILSAAIGGAGINLDPTCNKTVIKGNYIGTDNTGTLALGNYVIGIILKSDSCIIGGTNPGEGNIIADTKSICGLLIANSNDNTVKGNYIGVGLNNTPLPNKTNGISISVENTGSTASRNIVQNNTIAYNNGNGINVGGVALSGLTNNSNQLDNNLRFNSIYCNKQLGISLNFTTPTSQGNNGKTAPIINNALSTSSKVVGLANGLLSTDQVDIYEMSECLSCDLNPQGKKYIATVSPDAAGNWSYNQGTPITGTLIATATDALGNTSQFSLCFTPCDAKAIVSPTEYSVMLEMNKPITISLNSSSVFSNLTKVPGKTFWSMGAADTTAPALFSTANSVNLNFAVGGGAGSFGPGLYNVYLIAKQSGCADTAKVKLNIFFIPNMITPNGDQKNDHWSVGNESGQFDAKIYNRWGDLVYFKSDYTNEWDGSGLSEGVYYYLLEDKTQSSKSYKGWVEILK